MALHSSLCVRDIGRRLRIVSVVAVYNAELHYARSAVGDYVFGDSYFGGDCVDGLIYPKRIGRLRDASATNFQQWDSTDEEYMTASCRGGPTIDSANL